MMRSTAFSAPPYSSLPWLAPNIDMSLVSSQCVLPHLLCQISPACFPSLHFFPRCFIPLYHQLLHCLLASATDPLGSSVLLLLTSLGWEKKAKQQAERDTKVCGTDKRRQWQEDLLQKDLVSSSSFVTCLKVCRNEVRKLS